MIVKVCVTRHFIPAGKEGVGQGATPPIKWVPVIVKQAGKRHSDVATGCCRPTVVQQSTEIQGGHIAPSFEGVRQDAVHHIVGHVG